MSLHEIGRQETRQEIGQTSVPMKYGEQIVQHDNCAKQVRKVGVTLGAIQKYPKLVHFDQTKASEYRIVTNALVEYVQRHQAQAIDVETRRVHVVMPQSHWIGLQHALFQVTGAKIEYDVACVQKVGKVVEYEPVEFVLGVDFVEREAVNHHPKVVQKSQRNNEALEERKAYSQP
jgi:hypothetical protein